MDGCNSLVPTFTDPHLTHRASHVCSQQRMLLFAAASHGESSWTTVKCSFPDYILCESSIQSNGLEDRPRKVSSPADMSIRLSCSLTHSWSKEGSLRLSVGLINDWLYQQWPSLLEEWVSVRHSSSSSGRVCPLSGVRPSPIRFQGSGDVNLRMLTWRQGSMKPSQGVRQSSRHQLFKGEGLDLMFPQETSLTERKTALCNWKQLIRLD